MKLKSNPITVCLGVIPYSQAQVGGHQYVELMIAQHFTQIDGSSQLYIGREMIIPSAAAWPVPHDAPYKPNLDRYIMAITEVRRQLAAVDYMLTFSLSFLIKRNKYFTQQII